MTGVLQTLLGGFGAAAAAVTDAYFNLTTLLLPGNGTNGAQNNTFLDSSTNNFTITRNGNTTQGTFSPFSQTGWSNFFDGSSRLDFPTTAPYQIGSSDFTYETWVYVTASGLNPTIYWNANSSGYAALAVRINSATGNPVRLSFSTSGSSWVADTDYGTTNLNTWNHIAVVRSGNNIKLYLNGVDITSGGVAVSGSLMTTYTLNQLAAYNSTSYRLTGYLSNTRIVIGAALYTSNFTPSTSPLTTTSQGATAAQTEILTCQSNRFVDNSDNGAAITVNGTPSVQAFSPFAPTAAYSAATVGGSGYFDGTGDYLTGSAPLVQTTSTSTFTLEGWIYPTTFANTIYPFGDMEPTGGTFAIGIQITTGGIPQLYWFDGAGKTCSGAAMKLNQWNYFAFVVNANAITAYINSTTASQSGTTTLTTRTATSNFAVGQWNGSTTPNAYISSLRCSTVARTISAIPTAPFVSDGNTRVLLNFTNAGITDATAKNDLETVGNAQISTTQSKFGGSSMYFDGTGDYLTSNAATTDLYAFGSGDFTIEMWIRFDVVNAIQCFYDNRPAASQGAYSLLYLNSDATIRYFVSSADRITSSAVLANTWYHVALSRSGTSTRMFINGTQAGSTYTDSTVYLNATSRPWIGINSSSTNTQALSGYIDDLRVTKGFARYTANFTAPTAAFPTQ